MSVQVKQVVPAIDSRAPEGVRNPGATYELDDEDEAIRLFDDGAVVFDPELADERLEEMRVANIEHIAERDAPRPWRSAEEESDAAATEAGAAGAPKGRAARRSRSKADGDGDGDATENDEA